MDQLTHTVRRSNWINIIRQCQDRPAGTTAKQWLAENDISEKSYYYWLRKIRREVREQEGLQEVTNPSALSFVEIPVKTALDTAPVPTVPAAMPPPPAESAPPPSHARAAFCATAPDSADMAVPVDAVPNVVATHIAALGASAATAAPVPIPAAPPIPVFTNSLCVFFANSSVLRKLARSALIFANVLSNSFGVFAMLLTRSSRYSG